MGSARPQDCFGLQFQAHCLYTERSVCISPCVCRDLDVRRSDVWDAKLEIARAAVREERQACRYGLKLCDCDIVSYRITYLGGTGLTMVEGNR
jgi:hypothetical protein